MSNRLFLQFFDSEKLNWFYVAGDQISQSGNQSSSELSTLKKQFPSASVIVLIPSNDCLISRVTMPTRQRRQQLKAIPFAVEEQLADDVENMHFAIGKRLDNNQLPVVAVAKNKMQNWLDILAEAGFSATALLPLSALLEAPIGAWSIFQLDDLFIINQDGNSWTAQASEAAMMLSLSIQELDDNLPNLLFWGAENAPDWVNGLGLEISEQKVPNPLQSLLGRYEQQTVNLLQGDFEVKDDWHASWKVWRHAAIFAVVAIVLKFSLMGFDLYRLNAEKQYIKNEIARVYHQVAPGARISAYPERQMRQLLTQKHGGQNQPKSFLIMLSKLGEGLKAEPGIRPTNLSYDNTKGEIRLDLLVSNLPVLDALKENLVRRGLSVEVGGASAQGNDYSGRLIIRSES